MCNRTTTDTRTAHKSRKPRGVAGPCCRRVFGTTSLIGLTLPTFDLVTHRDHSHGAERAILQPRSMSMCVMPATGRHRARVCPPPCKKKIDRLQAPSVDVALRQRACCVCSAGPNAVICIHIVVTLNRLSSIESTLDCVARRTPARRTPRASTPSRPTTHVFSSQAALNAIYARRRRIEPIGKLHMSPVGHVCQSEGAGPMSYGTSPERRIFSCRWHATFPGGSE